ncbi:MAG: hypothetical protein Q4C47_05540, partial [Planctomycetia bacterium]|nr:hypothetical protein [Planctomycetia bacterium]
TLESLPELTEIQSLEVPVRAIVTPAVLDELRRHGVSLEYVRLEPVETSGVSAAVAKPDSGVVRTPVQVVLAVVLSRFTGTDGLMKTVRQMELDATLYTGNCLIQATDELSTSLVGRNRLGILVTDHPAAAICLMNRRRGLRAIQAVARGAEVVVRDAVAVGANLLVIDPREIGFWIMRQTVQRFLKSGPYQVPDVLRSQLD